MIVKILTLFPEMFDAFLNTSIIGRAVDQGIIQVELLNIRDFAKNKHKQVDDYPYGGGNGMILKPEPLFDCIDHARQDMDGDIKSIYLSPKGIKLNQNICNKLSNLSGIILLCGHYEGVDQRVIDNKIDMELSIGDYVLTGGELPAMVVIDSITRLLPGVLSNKSSYEDETFYSGLLEYAQYTRPYDYKGYKVPDVLLSGDHKKIQEWRKKKSIELTQKKRPDLIE
ncbi:MAG: tRNA (guanosine(37)-N1)-methyltransferase TrmD [Clostridia bacterium]|nr:tRNA (guanosine(37)-N1)-methyltransferase TrmD [Clostridia bacterium]